MSIKDLARTLKEADASADQGAFSYAYGVLVAGVKQHIRESQPAGARKEQLTFAATLPSGLPMIAEVDEWSDAGQVCAVYVGDVDIADDLTDEAKSALDAKFVQALSEEAYEAAEYRADSTDEFVAGAV